MRKSILMALLFLLSALGLVGCAPPVQLAGIHRVAVMTPDIKQGPAIMAGEVKRGLLSRVPRRFAFEVVDGTQIESMALGTAGGQIAIGDLGKVASICERNGIDALLLTSVTSYEETRTSYMSVIASGDPQVRLGIQIELGVNLTLNATLIKIKDLSIVFSQSAPGTASRHATLDPKYPLASLNNLLAPHFEQLRQSAIRNAIYILTRQAAREFR